MKRRIAIAGQMGVKVWIILLALNVSWGAEMKSTPGTYDCGESYWANGREIKLLRVRGELQVGLKAPSQGEFVARLSSEKTALDGFNFVRASGAKRATFSARAPQAVDLEATISRLQADPVVKWASPTFVSPKTGGRLWATNEVIVALRAGVRPDDLLGEGFDGYRHLRGSLDQWIASVPGGSLAALRVANELRADPRVLWASPNFCREIKPASVAPDDEYYGVQWNLKDTGQTGSPGNGLGDINVEGAWDETTGSDQIVIAIIDSGIDITHLDLASNIWSNPGEVQDDIDNDGNGYVDDLHGWNFVDDNNDVSPTWYGEGHGTSVAGIAAAIGNNSIGVTGVAWNVTILPVKVYDSSPYCEDAVGAGAIYYAAGFGEYGEPCWRGADVINCSWTSYEGCDALEAACDRVTSEGRGHWAGDNRGAIVVCASGNEAATVYRRRTVGPFVPGQYIFKWELHSEYGLTFGCLANVHFPNGSLALLDNEDCLQGWTTGIWEAVWDPMLAHGLSGGWVVKASLPQSGNAYLQSPSITVNQTGYLTYDGWPEDTCLWLAWMKLYASDDGGQTFTEKDYFDDGQAEPAGSSPAPMQGYLGYPAEYDSTIAVGASTDGGFRAAYSQFGPQLDLVAPGSEGYGSIRTTDLHQENWGYNPPSGYGSPESVFPNDTAYTSNFTGTSAACPAVAGVAALMLSKNYNLKAETVRSIMRSTCVKIGPIEYDDGGNGRNDYYGYGKIDAAAAVAMVKKGDRDGDGDVDLDDFGVVFASWGQHVNTGHPADPSRDGFVDEDDYDIVCQDYTGTPPETPDPPQPDDLPNACFRIKLREGGGTGYVDAEFDDTYLTYIGGYLATQDCHGAGSDIGIYDYALDCGEYGYLGIRAIALLAVRDMFTYLPPGTTGNELYVNSAKLILYRHTGPAEAPLSFARVTTNWLEPEGQPLLPFGEGNCSAMYRNTAYGVPWGGDEWFGTYDYDTDHMVPDETQEAAYNGKEVFDVTEIICDIYDAGVNYGFCMVGEEDYDPGEGYWGSWFRSSEYTINGEPDWRPVLQIDYQYGPDYTLTVNSGTGDGQYPKDLPVGIQANAAPTGLKFWKWVGDTAGLASTTAASTTCTMPAGDMEITARYTYKGDLNCDGFVGQADLNIVLAQWGRGFPGAPAITDPCADANGDGRVGQGDLDIVLVDWGKSAPPAGEGEGMMGGGGQGMFAQEAFAEELECLDSLGQISLEISQVDGNEVIPGSTVYVTNVLTITTDSDWISGQIVVSPTGVSSPIYNPMSGAYAPYFSEINGYTDEEGQWVSGHPYYAYDSFATAGMRTGLDQYYPEEPCYVGVAPGANAADLTGSGGSAVWSTSAINQAWWTMYDDEEGERVVAQVTLKDTAQGTWSFRATASPADGPAVVATGTIVDGVMVPDE